MKDQLRPALTMLLLLTVLTGLIYPLAVTGLAQLVFPDQANGSLIVREGKVIGSKLIGQYFDKPEHLESSVGDTVFNAAASGDQTRPTNPVFDAVKARVVALRADPGNAVVPVDLVTSSGAWTSSARPPAPNQRVARAEDR